LIIVTLVIGEESGQYLAEGKKERWRKSGRVEKP